MEMLPNLINLSLLAAAAAADIADAAAGTQTCTVYVQYIIP